MKGPNLTEENVHGRGSTLNVVYLIIQLKRCGGIHQEPRDILGSNFLPQ
jgi:hypothetical protein